MNNFIRTLSIISVLTLFSTIVSAETSGREISVYADYMLSNVSPKTSTPGGISLHSGVFNNIMEFGGGYTVRNTSPSIELLAGVRYTNLELSLSPGVPTNRGQNLLDGFGGVRLIQELGENSNWSLIGKADVGGGNSNLTWNAMAGVNWQYSKRGSLNAGYKWLAYNYQTGADQGQFTHKGVYQGPMVNMVFTW